MKKCCVDENARKHVYAWQIRDVEHGKVFSFETLMDMIEFVKKFANYKEN